MNKDAERIGVWGASGSGKSTRVKELLKGNKRCIVIDPQGDWARDSSFRSYKTQQGLFKAMKSSWKAGFRLVLEVDEEKDHLPDVLQSMARAMFIVQRPYNEGKDKRQITLVIDEMADMFPNRTLSAEQQSFTKLCRKGRHYGVNIIGASQRLAEVHTSFRGNQSRAYYFRQAEAVDVQRALQSLGTEHKPALLGLADHEYLLKEGGRVTKGKNRCDWLK
tara:strand:+ start:1089 stop:1748 length:660 start_codon:yes stop_codon:yes gene_type:complete